MVENPVGSLKNVPLPTRHGLLIDRTAVLSAAGKFEGDV